MKIKAITLNIIFILTATALNYSFAQEQYEANKLWTTEKVFNVPESVYYNEDGDILYVANINGKPTQEDGNGFISKLHMDGSMETLKWIEGLSAPKGMGMANGDLYVTDINEVVVIDVEENKISKRYKAKNAQFLNDITVDKHGRIYISDMQTGALYRIENDKMDIWFPVGSFNRPNGLNYHQNKILLGTNGRIYSIDPENKTKSVIAEVDVSVDGLEVRRNGDLIFSDWSGKVQITPGDHKQSFVLFDTSEQKINAADIHFIQDKELLLVPTFFDNRVMGYKIQ